jgi:hypothetical protein
MPAKSKAQQRAAGAALSAKRGETPKSKLKGASKQMEASLSETARRIRQHQAQRQARTRCEIKRVAYPIQSGRTRTVSRPYRA